MIGGADLVQMLADPESGFVITPIIDPDGQIGTASIDIRLGPDIIVSRRATGATTFDASDPHAFREALRMRQAYVRRGVGDPFHLQPGEFVIARSLEYVQLPPDVSAEALGRSSWGRLGLVIATATLIQPAFRGTITLELANVGNTPLMLQVGLSIAQLTFTRDGSNLITARSASVPLHIRDATKHGEGTEEHEQFEERKARRERRIRRAASWWAKAEASDDRKPPSRYKGQVRPELSRLHRDKDLLWVAPMALKYVVGVAGHRFAGKSTVVNFLISRRGFRLYRLAQFVYEEALRRGEDISDHEALRRVGDDMRERWEDDVLARMAFARIRADHLDADRQRQPAAIVIEGFTVPAELAAWQRLDIFRTLLVEAPSQVRLTRALTAGALGDEQAQEAVPPEQDGAAREKWLRRWVDEREDRRHHAAPLIDEALTAGSTLRLDNSVCGVDKFEDQLKEKFRRLELWARSRPF